jgi:hypothetical protein
MSALTGSLQNDDDNETTAVAAVCERIGALPSGFRAARRLQNERTTGEWTVGDLIVMPAENLYDACVESTGSTSWRALTRLLTTPAVSLFRGC